MSVYHYETGRPPAPGEVCFCPCCDNDPKPVDPNGWEEPYDDDPPDDGANQPEERLNYV